MWKLIWKEEKKPNREQGTLQWSPNLRGKLEIKCTHNHWKKDLIAWNTELKRSQILSWWPIEQHKVHSSHWMIYSNSEKGKVCNNAKEKKKKKFHRIELVKEQNLLQVYSQMWKQRLQTELCIKNRNTSLPNRNAFSAASSADLLIRSVHIPFLFCMCNNLSKIFIMEEGK